MEKGYLSLVLHAHLPYVRHPEYKSFLEEDWFFEAITETYIPLIRAFQRLTDDGVDFRMTLSLSPPLVAMLQDPLLQERYIGHISRLTELTEKEMDRNRSEPRLRALAEMYHDLFSDCKRVFTEDYGLDLVQAFRKFRDAGKLDLVTCGATHGYLPLMEQFPSAVRAQIRLAVESHTTHEGTGERTRRHLVARVRLLPRRRRLPGGSGHPVYVRGHPRRAQRRSQVPSCGSRPRAGSAPGRRTGTAPSAAGSRGWRRTSPGPACPRKALGLKYYRITGETDEKELYEPAIARQRVIEHAANFVFNRERQIEHLHDAMGKRPIVVAPYDAELFGHWWFEGPLWLEAFFRKVYEVQGSVRTCTPMDYMGSEGPFQTAKPFHSSWGYKGYSEVWLNTSNHYIYTHLHRAAGRMTELAKAHPHAEGLRLRALNQAARELLLAQASDWAFIIKTGTMAEYAHKRTRAHIARFTRLYEDIRNNRVDETFLHEIEWRDRIFQWLDYRIYAEDGSPDLPGAVEEMAA